MPNPLYGSGQELAKADLETDTPRWEADPNWQSLPTATRLGYVDAWRAHH
jgi:hypothetical protein